jgi:hypothetical protein
MELIPSLLSENQAKLIKYLAVIQKILNFKVGSSYSNHCVLRTECFKFLSCNTFLLEVFYAMQGLQFVFWADITLFEGFDINRHINLS